MDCRVVIRGSAVPSNGLALFPGGFPSGSRCSLQQFPRLSRATLGRKRWEHTTGQLRLGLHSSCRRSLSVRASSDDSSVGGPLSPESPSGQLLRELIQSHPHLVPSAAEQQLELLAEQGQQAEQAQGGEGEKKTGSELVLYKRIEEMKRQERQRAVEEVIYSLIVQRFIAAGCPLLPKVPFVTLDPSNPLTLGMMSMVPTAPPRKEELEAVHSPEVLEMVHEHLERVLGGKSGGIPGGSAMEDRVLVGTSRMRLGQVYAASIMYGYFLRRVDQKFQLEKGLRAMLGGSLGLPSAPSVEEKLEEEKRARMDEFLIEGDSSLVEGVHGKKAKNSLGSDVFGLGTSGAGEQGGKPPSALRAYVTSFDASALQSAVTVRSREGISVVERHTEALFGRPDVLSVEGGVAVLKDDQTHITVSTLRRLILEAVAFGNFLWDVETYVDSRCKITN